MVWLNKKGSIIMPAGGEKKATITVAGTQWNVYFDSQQRRWRYIAYERAKPSVVASFDLKDFINDAVSRGYLESSWYLDSMEAGFEIIQDGKGLTNRRFRRLLPAGMLTRRQRNKPAIAANSRWRAYKK